MSLLTLSSFNFWGGGKNFYTNLKTLIQFNTSTAHVEQTKTSDSQSINTSVSILNANNDTVSAIRRTFEKQVIGTKLNIQSYTEDDEFNKQFERNLRVWSKKGNCEITGRFYRGSAERYLIGEQEVLSGGFILRHHFDSSFIMGYKFEIIPLNTIDRTKTDFTNLLFNGIQTNKFGEITAIYIYTDHTKKESIAIPYSELILNVKIWLDATQYSGVSPLAPILATLDLLDEYTNEEMKGAKNRAKNNIIIRTHFYAEMKKIAQKNSNGTITAQQLKEIYEKFKLDDNGDITGAKYIPQEDEVVELGKSTQSIYSQLDLNKKRSLSSGLGLSSMSTVGEMASSYNATLYFSKLEEGTFEISNEDFVEGAWREVIENKLIMGMVLFGKINALNYWAEPELYRNIEFIRKSSGHIDPSKVQKARSEGIANKTNTIIDILSSDGVDYQEQIAKEVKYEVARKKAFEDAGLEYVQTNIELKVISAPEPLTKKGE